MIVVATVHAGAQRFPFAKKRDLMTDSVERLGAIRTFNFDVTPCVNSLTQCEKSERLLRD